MRLKDKIAIYFSLAITLVQFIRIAIIEISMKEIIIYAIGYVVSYLAWKRLNKISDFEWTVGSRNLALFLSIFSWLSLIASLIVILAVNSVKNKEKANW